LFVILGTDRGLILSPAPGSWYIRQSVFDFAEPRFHFCSSSVYSPPSGG
jgi:hypothetical protein